MTRIAIFLFVSLLSLPAFADDTASNGSEEFGDRVTGVNFLQRFQGDYVIELANGEKPDTTNRSAKISLDEDDLVMTFPFCMHGAACDPGYLLFPVKTVEIYQKNLGQEHDLFTLLTTEDGKKLKYSLEVDGSKYTFTNYQYVTPNQQTITLVHVFKKP